MIIESGWSKWVKIHPWYRAYSSAKRRCQLKNHSYQKRGIKFSMKAEDFKFLWFRDKAYLMKKPSIDRIDTTGHYTLSNCRYLEWAENRKRTPAKAWLKHKFCRVCSRKDKPHFALGCCKLCYGRIRVQRINGLSMETNNEEFLDRKFPSPRFKETLNEQK